MFVIFTVHYIFGLLQRVIKCTDVFATVSVLNGFRVKLHRSHFATIISGLFSCSRGLQFFMRSLVAVNECRHRELLMNSVVASGSGVVAHPGVDAVVIDAIRGAVVLEVKR